jgi:hypothetical protein
MEETDLERVSLILAKSEERIDWVKAKVRCRFLLT